MSQPGRMSDPRYVLWPDPSPDEKGYRACVVVENEPGYQRYGNVSNDPKMPTPLYIGKTEDEAQRWCLAWNKERFGYSEEEQRLIVLSSMRRQPIKAIHDDEADCFTIFRDGEEVLTLDSDECEDLVRQLYKLRWPYSGPEYLACGQPLMGFECVNQACPECPDHHPSADCGDESRQDDDEEGDQDVC